MLYWWTYNSFVKIFSFLVRWSTSLHTSTVHKTASLADEGNSSYCQSIGAYNTKHNLWKLALRCHLNTDAKARDRIRNFLLMRTDILIARPHCRQAIEKTSNFPQVLINIPWFFNIIRDLKTIPTIQNQKPLVQ